MIKKSIVSILLALSLWLASGLVGPGALADCPQWTPIISPGGGGAFPLLFDPANPNIVYARGRGGMYKSTNGGNSWHAINTGLTNLVVQALVINPVNPTTLYVGTNGGGIFKSINSGGSWSAVNTGLINFTVWSMAIDPP
jgi:hypothetical protein